MLHELFFVIVGFVSCIVCIIGAVVFGLGVIENKQDSERRIRSFKEEITKKTDDAPIGSPPQIQKQTWMKILTQESADPRWGAIWQYFVLKSNMLFQFPDDKATSCSRVICLDECIITTEAKKKNGQPQFKGGIKNCIVISHPTRALLDSYKSFQLYFKTSKDLEQFYYYLVAASSLNAKNKVSEDRAISAKYFSKMRDQLHNTSLDAQPHWLSAILARVFFNYADSDSLNNAIKQKITKKITKLKEKIPKFVKEISVLDAGLGPNVPVFNSVQLLSLTQDGEMEVDADFYYGGGFRLVIQIVFEISLPAKKVFLLPAVASVTLQSLSGKVRIFSAAPPSRRLWLSFHDDPKCDLSIDTQIGGNYKLQKLTKLSAILVHTIKHEIFKVMTLPSTMTFHYQHQKQHTQLTNHKL